MEPAKASSRRCAIYTRKSSEEGLEQDFNSLQAQREACEAFIKSQAGEGWRLVKTAYDDGGLSGATMERPALQRVLGDINQGLIDVVVVYKVDRLTRSLTDFAKMVEVFDAHGVRSPRARTERTTADVERQTPHRSRRIELLGDCDEGFLCVWRPQFCRGSVRSSLSPRVSRSFNSFASLSDLASDIMRFISTIQMLHAS